MMCGKDMCQSCRQSTALRLWSRHVQLNRAVDIVHTEELISPHTSNCMPI